MSRSTHCLFDACTASVSLSELLLWMPQHDVPVTCGPNADLPSLKKKPNVCFTSLWTGCFSPAGTADTHTQTSPSEVATPCLPGSGNAECDDAELMGNIIKKGGGTKEAPSCRLTIEWGELSESCPP